MRRKDAGGRTEANRRTAEASDEPPEFRQWWIANYSTSPRKFHGSRAAYALAFKAGMAARPQTQEQS
jgi:hypothetical protein